MQLTRQARETIKWRVVDIPGASIAGYIRSQFPDGQWAGDGCGCTDDRCKDGYHHDPHEECGCLAVLLDAYACGALGHQWSQTVHEADYGRGPVRWRLCTRCTAADHL